MKKFIIETGTVVPLDRANVDTDAILPKQFLKSIKRTGFGVNLFDEWRYSDPWHDGIDDDNRHLNPDFVINDAMYQGATVLLARDNFGCGSSREHAVWALDDYGFRALIAPSFGEIFYHNCCKNGILPVRLAAHEVDALFRCCTGKALALTIDLPAQTVSGTVLGDGKSYTFTIDPFRKDCMLNGLDEIALTLQHADEIKSFEQRYQRDFPWVFENTKI